ncbi:general secretion pathway protein GspB [Herbaspirillum sp. GCM10030257]|uniref:general secretion pathway protein GspB n=1 Tax=Herbaspirillum sp. GCM10030257 TaxID=3273393 RepID=UPI00361AB773
MSYILDALKKAEAERRGTTPPVTPAPATYYERTQRDSVWHKPWPWALLSAAVVTVAGATWFATRSDQAVQVPSPETPQVVAQAPVVPVTPQMPAPAVTQSAPPAAAPPAQIASPAPATTQPAPPSPAPTKAEAAQVPPSAVTPPKATRESPPEAPQARTEKPARKPVEKKPAREPEAPKKSVPATAPAASSNAANSDTATASTTPAAPATEPAVGSVRDLPPQIQQQIPALTIGGYIYSANKADRSVLINKRLLRDGDEIAPGLTLERMTPSGMILNYKGYRYRSSY